MQENKIGGENRLKNINTAQKLDRFLWLHRKLLKISKSLHHLDECSCNYGLTPRQEKREMRLECEAEAIASELGLFVFHQSDPRGCSLYLLENQEDKNNYSSKGIAIY